MPDDEFEELEQTAVISLGALKGGSKPVQRNRHLLVWVHGERFGQVVLLTDAECTVGRHRDCTLCLDGEGVSRRHARIYRQGDAYVLEDLGSSNGTYVQGQRISQKPLKDGDILQFGPTAVFHYAVTDEDYETLATEWLPGSHGDLIARAGLRFVTGVTQPGVPGREVLPCYVLSPRNVRWRGRDILLK